MRTEEQITLALRQQESCEKTVAEISRELGISQATFFKWKQKYDGMSINEARRLKEFKTGKCTVEADAGQCHVG